MAKKEKVTDWQHPFWELQIHPDTGKLEPDRAHAGFQEYLAMPRSTRSLSALKVQLQRAKGSVTAASMPGKRARSSRIEEWCVTWNWVLRARAWDQECDRVRQEAQREEEVRIGTRHARGAEACLMALQRPMIAYMQRLQRDPNPLMTMDISKLLDLVAVGARVAPKLMIAERLALGMTTGVKVNKDGGRPKRRQEPAPLPEKLNFTWSEPDCECGHPHSRHDQLCEEPGIVPCTTAPCRCRNFKRCDPDENPRKGSFRRKGRRAG